ncbi:hypothetical protein N7499_000934 [Penicillium canescens]|uniref:Uncharacterized protein n=1 Tax=Penicillium canescens TaxID=5083 RepID=A0AAD6I336_PENCN|nr:hypothetical protein N7522_004128 [Penicillium canescens]KAJ6027379.1 hypothetical protein N7460_012196 [Penicillium canescens]KAJ6101304.1 hypothetical protein N7499_000934 [Penicillium canescens]KAJ6173762.1 hypothetical protein N7485_006574 [Penicillium canescens]
MELIQPGNLRLWVLWAIDMAFEQAAINKHVCQTAEPKTPHKEGRGASHLNHALRGLNAD